MGSKRRTDDSSAACRLGCFLCLPLLLGEPRSPLFIPRLLICLPLLLRRLLLIVLRLLLGLTLLFEPLLLGLFPRLEIVPLLLLFLLALEIFGLLSCVVVVGQRDR